MFETPEFSRPTFPEQDEQSRIAMQNRERASIMSDTSEQLTDLKDAVESSQLEDLFGEVFYDDIFTQNSEEKASDSALDDLEMDQHKAKAEGRTEFHAIRREETNAETTDEKAAEFHQEAAEYEEHGQTLATSDLAPMSPEKAQEIERFLADHPEVEPANGISIEVATDFGFEAPQTDKVWEIAEKLGNPFFHNGVPDLVKLTDPAERLWLSHLMALVNAFEQNPNSRFFDLPAEEMKALLTLYQTTIAEKHPHLGVTGGNFKWADLRDVGEQVVQSANEQREEAGTDLYAKAIQSGRRIAA